MITFCIQNYVNKECMCTRVCVKKNKVHCISESVTQLTSEKLFYITTFIILK